MGNTQELILTILSDDKLCSKVYSDEPILFTASQMKSYTPPKYLEMKRIAGTYEALFQSKANIFYNQAKYMEDFEDSFDYHGVFASYYPTYQSMSDMQLRGYFSWRTAVRRGIIEPTSLSFAFVYIYELINKIGVESAEEGFYKLKSFVQNYGKLDSKINSYAKLWLKDYVIYNGLDKALLEDSSDTDFDKSLLTLINYKEHEPAAVFEALNRLSSYNLEKSGFFKRNSQDVTDIVYRVYDSLAVYFEKNRKCKIYEKFFGTAYTSRYHMFSSAVFYEKKRHGNCTYIFNDAHKYWCLNGVWHCERFFCHCAKSTQLGALLKCVDYCMRQRFSYKPALKPVKTTKLFTDTINAAIDSYLVEKKRNARNVIQIDLSKLQGIRDTSLKTQSSLIVEEITDDSPPAEVPSAPQSDGGVLDSVQREFLSCLLNGKSYDGLLKKSGMMASILADSINEKLFDMFEDTVLVCYTDTPAPVEDYVKELKGIIGE